MDFSVYISPGERSLLSVTNSRQTEPGIAKPQTTTFLETFVDHPAGFWFIFWGEFAERCSYYGMRAILATYMVERLGMSKEDGGTYVSLFVAACYFLPLLG